MSSYTFITRQNQDSFDKPQSTPTKSYYQIAQFPHQTTKLYHIKKFKIDDGHNIVKVTEHNVKKQHWEQLQKQKKTNEYKLYSVYTLKNVPNPNGSDIQMLMSNMLSNNTNYTGFASF